MRAEGLSPATYHRVTLVALLALAFIVVTGGAVRLTGSGLGCPDWPACSNERLVAPLEYHAMVEFVNRAVTGIVSLSVTLAVLGSLLRRPRRRDLVVLSVGLVLGVAGQVVLGGLTVLFELQPPFVMAHFLLSMVLLWNAAVLHERAGEPDPPRRGRPSPPWAGLGWLLVGAAAVVVFTGTVVTAAGPHGGDERAVRLDIPIREAARVHGTAVVILLALTLVTLVVLHRAHHPERARRRGWVLLAVVVAQAGIGYLQYFTGVPALLVGAHIAGAVAVWLAVVRLSLALRAPTPPPATHDEGRREALVYT